MQVCQNTNFVQMTKQPTIEGLVAKEDPCKSLCKVTKVMSLTKAEIDSCLAAFDDNRGVDDNALRQAVQEHLLPRFQRELGWSNIRAIKCRANDRATFEQRYNADCHRDRHLFGGTREEKSQLATKNYSAVVYMDQATFRYFRNSSITHGLSQDSLNKLECVDVDIEPGEAVIFPSSTIHQARPSRYNPKSRRRTVVIFDMENPDDDEERVRQHLKHKIIICPVWTQWAMFHNILSDDAVSSVAFNRLMCNYPYSWRYNIENNPDKEDHAYLLHWQVTKNEEGSLRPTQDAKGAQKFNRSIYLIQHDAYPDYVEIVDHRNSLLYIFRLCIYSLKSWPSTAGLAGFEMWSILFTVVLAVVFYMRWYA